MLIVTKTTCKRITAADPTTGITYKVLFELASYSGLFYYQNNASYIASDPSCPHDKFMRVNVNAKASSALVSDGKLPPSGNFPDSSLIVKEISSAQAGSLKLYAVMYKMPKASNAGSGWVWAEYKSGGSAQTAAKDKGAKCIICHNTSKQRDVVKIFDLH